jgi:glycosyltransferase involved in cell wall biosynthesis
LFSTLVPLTLRRAHAVITDSEHAKVEILRLYPHLNGKVYVVHLAPNAAFEPIGDTQLVQEVRSRFGIRSDFILSVGNLQPRKNLPRLIQAYAAIRNRLGDTKLVIVGKARWQASDVFALVTRLGLEREVFFTGYVPNDDLVALYNAAKLFVYPSIYEGFGLPILEAMACGTPVVTSNTSSMVEVAGDAALLVDPFDEQDIAHAIHQAATNEGLAQSLVEKGARQAKQFSWRKTALDTVAVYRRVAGKQRAQE